VSPRAVPPLVTPLTEHRELMTMASVQVHLMLGRTMVRLHRVHGQGGRIGMAWVWQKDNRRCLSVMWSAVVLEMRSTHTRSVDEATVHKRENCLDV